MNVRGFVLVGAALLAVTGCFSVKTESEVKPIHITLDINLKVDKEIDKAFSDENMSRPKGQFAEIKRLLDGQRAGLTNRAMLEARQGATDDDRILIAEANSRRARRFAEISKSSGVSLEAVQKRSLRRFEEKVPAGSGVWIQNDEGVWRQK